MKMKDNKKVKIPKQNVPKEELLQPDRLFNTISSPNKDMIMPEEFNSVSNPKPSNLSESQATHILWQ